MWADCLGFDHSKNAPNPKPVGERFLKPQRKPETPQVPSVIPALPPDPEQDLFLNQDPPQKMVGGSEKVCKKKGEDFVMSSRIFVVCFFYSESGF